MMRATISVSVPTLTIGSDIYSFDVAVMSVGAAPIIRIPCDDYDSDVR